MKSIRLVIRVLCCAVLLGGVAVRSGYADASGRIAEIEKQISDTEDTLAEMTNEVEKAHWEQRLALQQKDLQNAIRRAELDEKEKGLRAAHSRHAGLALREALNVIEVDVAAPTEKTRLLDKEIQRLRGDRVTMEARLQGLQKEAEDNAATITDLEYKLRNVDDEILARRMERASIALRTRLAKEAQRIDELFRELPSNPDPTIKVLLEKKRYLESETAKQVEVQAAIDSLREQETEIGNAQELTRERMAHIDEETQLLERKKKILSSRGMDRRLVYAATAEKKYLAARAQLQDQQMAAVKEAIGLAGQTLDLISLERMYFQEDFNTLLVAYKKLLLIPISFIVGLIVLKMIVSWVLLPIFLSRDSLFIGRRLTSYLLVFAIIIVLSVFFLEDLKQIATVLGIASAAIVIALQDLCSAFAGWFVIVASRKFSIGDRVEIDGQCGDVLDVQLLRTTVLEVNNWLGVDEPTGRILLIPNNFVFKSKVFNYAHVHPYVWNKIDITVTFETPPGEAQALLFKILDEENRGELEDAKWAAGQMEKTYGVPDTVYQPKIFSFIADSGVTFRLVYVSHYRKVSGVRNRINDRILSEFDRDKRMQFAYPTERHIPTPEPGGFAVAMDKKA